MSSVTFRLMAAGSGAGSGAGRAGQSEEKRAKGGDAERSGEGRSEEERGDAERSGEGRSEEERGETKRGEEERERAGADACMRRVGCAEGGRAREAG
jgi:hypothetical protein